MAIASLWRSASGTTRFTKPQDKASVAGKRSANIESSIARLQPIIRGKYQDNLEFMQWMKAYYEMHQPIDGYDALVQPAAEVTSRASADELGCFYALVDASSHVSVFA